LLHGRSLFLPFLFLRALRRLLALPLLSSRRALARALASSISSLVMDWMPDVPGPSSISLAAAPMAVGGRSE
jgi:hypothetical protein